MEIKPIDNNKDNKKKFCIYLGIALVAALIAYWPSFSHLLRCETYTFFLNTIGHKGVLDILNHQMVMGYWPGDTWLFRPLLYGLLGLEANYFAFNPMPWHITAFVFHALSIVALFRLLWLIKPGKLALIFTTLYAVAYITVNAILYVQIAIYPLFIAIVLTSLFYLYKGMRENKRGSIIAAIILMSIASFCYEIGMVFLILIGGFLWLKRSRITWTRWKVVIPALLFVWFTLYAAQHIFATNELASSEFGVLSALSNIVYGTGKIVTIAGTWLSHITLPSLFNLEPQLAMERSPVVFTSLNDVHWDNINYFTLIPNLIILSGLGYFLWKRKPSKKKSTNTNISLMLPLTLMLSAFLLITSLFRSATRGVESYILETNNNANLFLAILIPLIYTFPGVRRLANRRFTFTRRNVCIYGALIILIATSFFKLYTINQQVIEAEKPIKDYIVVIEDFVEEHKDEPDFSFISKVADQELEERMTLHLWKEWDPLKRVYEPHTLVQIQHYDYWDETDPKYVLYYEDEKLAEVEWSKIMGYLSETMLFGEGDFNLHSTHLTLAEVEVSAHELRITGWNVQVVKHFGLYGVYKKRGYVGYSN